MKKLGISIFVAFVLTLGLANAIVYEDAEDGNTVGWTIYDNTPVGAVISNVTDPLKGKVIALAGSSIDNGYRFDLGHSTETTLSWDMKYNESFTIFVLVTTVNNGPTFIIYNDVAANPASNIVGLGTNASDNTWRTFSRDLSADLLAKYHDASDSIVSVDAFMIRGTGFVDNITSSPVVIIAPPIGDILEDAEDGTTTGWTIYDSDPAGATVSNVTDATQGKVIELSGLGLQNGYMLGHWGADGFKVTKRQLSWKMKYDEMFSVYVIVKTEDGNRYLWYTAEDTDRGLQLGGRYIHHGIGSGAMNGLWNSFSRNLQTDLKEYAPTLNVLEVNAFLVRGSGRVDDIKVSTAVIAPS